MTEEVKVDLNEIGSFNKESLKRVEINEKDVLPDPETIANEKREVNLREAIEKGTTLKHVEVSEKVSLPTKEDIEAEKSNA